MFSLPPRTMGAGTYLSHLVGPGRLGWSGVVGMLCSLGRPSLWTAAWSVRYAALALFLADGCMCSRVLNVTKRMDCALCTKNPWCVCDRRMQVVCTCIRRPPACTLCKEGRQAMRRVSRRLLGTNLSTLQLSAQLLDPTRPLPRGGSA
jgi:hypothetical protein